VQILDVTGPLEVFSRAARWMQDHGLRRDLAYRVEVVAPRAGAFATSSGCQLVAERAYREVTSADTLLVAGGRGYATARASGPAARMASPDVRVASRAWAPLHRCAAPRNLGLLEGRRATTHWAYLEELKKSVGLGLCHDAIYTRDGNLYTSPA